MATLFAKSIYSPPFLLDLKYSTVSLKEFISFTFNVFTSFPIAFPILFTKPERDLPGPISTKVLTPSFIIYSTDCCHSTELLTWFTSLGFISSLVNIGRPSTLVTTFSLTLLYPPWIIPALIFLLQIPIVTNEMVQIQVVV